MRPLLLLAFAVLLLPHTASARFTDFALTRFANNVCGILESGQAVCASGPNNSLNEAFLAPPNPDQTYTAINATAATEQRIS